MLVCVARGDNGGWTWLNYTVHGQGLELRRLNRTIATHCLVTCGADVEEDARSPCRFFVGTVF